MIAQSAELMVFHFINIITAEMSACPIYLLVNAHCSVMTLCAMQLQLYQLPIGNDTLCSPVM